MSYFDLNNEERRSFLGAAPKFVSIDGPIHLVRFMDTERVNENRRQAMSGRYWMYGSEVEEVLETGGIPLVRAISERWAICDDWGDCARVAVLQVGDGRHVDAWFGFAKFQPRISVKAQRATGRTTQESYGGGSLQLLLNITEQELRWMSGPFLANQLHVKYLHFRP